jgi:hypothetical protein
MRYSIIHAMLTLTADDMSTKTRMQPVSYSKDQLVSSQEARSIIQLKQ